MYDLKDAGQPTSNKVLLNSLGLNWKVAPKHGGKEEIQERGGLLVCGRLNKQGNLRGLS